MPTLRQLQAIRAILENDQSPVSACWFAAVQATDFGNEDEPTLKISGMRKPDEPAIEMPDPEAFLSDLERAIDHTVSDFIRAKVLAGLSAYMTDLVYNDLPTFIDFANLTNTDDPPLPGVFNPANATECGLALIEIGLIDTDLSPRRAAELSKQFSQEIRAYWGAILSSEGAVGPVPPFGGAIMSAVDPLSDVMLFEAMAAQTDQYGDTLRRALWSYSQGSFHALQRLSDPDGKPLIDGKTMKDFMVALVGEPSGA